MLAPDGNAYKWYIGAIVGTLSYLFPIVICQEIIEYITDEESFLFAVWKEMPPMIEAKRLGCLRRTRCKAIAWPFLNERDEFFESGIGPICGPKGCWISVIAFNYGCWKRTGIALVRIQCNLHTGGMKLSLNSIQDGEELRTWDELGIESVRLPLAAKVLAEYNATALRVFGGPTSAPSNLKFAQEHIDGEIDTNAAIAK
jgi:hypothetical protein